MPTDLKAPKPTPRRITVKKVEEDKAPRDETVIDEPSGPFVPPQVDRDPQPYRPGKIAKQLEPIYAMVGIGVSTFDQFCGQTILASSSDMAQSMEKLALENPAVKRVLEKLFTVSTLGAVITAHLPVIFAIANHHVPHMRQNLMAQFSAQQTESDAQTT